MVNLFGPGAFGSARPAATRPALTPANGAGDPDDFYKDCTSPEARDGTEIRAGLLNALIANLRTLVRKSGQADSNLDDALLARAVRRQGLNYVASVGGTANDITVTLDPAPASYAEITGAVFSIVPSTSNSGAGTINVNALGAVALNQRDGAALRDRALVAGQPVQVICLGSSFRVLGITYPEVPVVLAANPIIYVRTDGNNANDGSANTAGAAFLTIQAAIDAAIRRFVLAGRSVTIQLGNAGTYGAFSVPPTPGSLVIQGDVANQASYIISGTGSGGLSGTSGVTGASVKIAGVTLRNGANNTNTLASVGGATIQLDRVTIDAVGTIGWAHLLALPNSSIQIIGNVTIGAQQCAVAFDAQGGNIEASNVTCQFSNPVISTAVARATNLGRISMFSTTQGGSVFSGKRYAVDLNSVINTFGGGANYFLGSIAGTTATGGQYA
jgi:hypothetical protein